MMMTLLQAAEAIRSVGSGTTPASCWDKAKTVAETMKAVAEAFAFLSAGAFFLYKTVSGYMIANLTLGLNCERKVSGQVGVDYLVVTAQVKKGDRGAVTLHDAKARISAPAPGEEASKPLSGIIRFSYKTSGKIIEIVEKQSESKPLLNLSPGEETVFSTFFRVPSDQPCTVDVTLLGVWPWHFKTHYQWRASQVSLPNR